jgi:hypothetical protein
MAIGEHRSAGPTSGLAKSLLVVLAMRDELLAELIGWLDHANLDAYIFAAVQSRPSGGSEWASSCTRLGTTSTRKVPGRTR